MGAGLLFDFKKNLWFKFFSFSFNIWKEKKTSGSVVVVVVVYFILFY
jgi:hypothetical protein